MANYVLVDADQLDADLTSIANTIRAKGGTSAQLAFPDGFNSAINAISTGITVQRTSGTFTTDSDGSATVDCGFRPDLVAVLVPDPTAYGNYYDAVFGFDVLADRGGSYCHLSESEEYMMYIYAYRTSTGFEVYNAKKYGLDWSDLGAVSNQTFQYAAVKYTA